MFGSPFRQVAFVGYADGLLYQHVLHSLQLVVLGFAVAVATGVPLGLLIGWNRKAEALINPVPLYQANTPARMDSAGNSVAGDRRRRKNLGDLVCRVRAVRH